MTPLPTLCFLVDDAPDQGDGGTCWGCLHGHVDVPSTAFEILHVKDAQKEESGTCSPVTTQVSEVACLR